MSVPLPWRHWMVKREELANGCRSFNHVTNGGGVPAAKQDNVRELPAEALMLGGGGARTLGFTKVGDQSEHHMECLWYENSLVLLQFFSSLPSLHCPIRSHLYARGTHLPSPTHWNCEGRHDWPATAVAKTTQQIRTDTEV